MTTILARNAGYRIRCVCVAVEADDLREPEVGAEGQGVDQVVTAAAGRGCEDRSGVAVGESCRGPEVKVYQAWKQERASSIFTANRVRSGGTSSQSPIRLRCHPCGHDLLEW